MRTKRHIQYAALLMAAITGLTQPCTAMAVEQTDSVETIKYITAFEMLPEEDAYLPCMYKPALEELSDVFPETLFVQTEGEEDFTKLEVTWECEEDFDATDFDLYLFYPKWDETLYEIAESAKDSIEIPFIAVEVPLNNGAVSDLQEAKSSLYDILAEKSVLALIYLCDEYDVKESPSYDSGNVITAASGQSVQITDVETDEDGFVWYRVLLYQNEKEYTGYVEKEYLATADENFTQWEDTYIALPEMGLMTLSAGCPDVDQFPASYQNALYTLKDKHPNWIFVRMDTGIDWNRAISSELGDKSLVHSSSSGSWQNGTYGQGWSYASEGILKYYMDPRNFLTDPSIFQFEQLTYNSSYHTTNAVQEIIKNSFMSSATLENGQSYAQAFTGIGESLGISPFHLASRVLQEQGTQGASSIISGTYADYKGYYNYFNVGATGKTNEEVIVNGLKKAVQYGWNTRYKSLYGGASIVGSNYILRGQDTLYLEKFNVSNGQYANFTHQYMQNIQAPNSEASNIRKAYNNAGALENNFVFKIPVYNNMPASACSKPETTDAITLDKTIINNLEVNKTVTLTPYVNGSRVDHVNNMSFDSDNTTVAAVDNQGKVTALSPGTAVISCTRSGANTAKCTVTVIKANPAVSTPTLSPVTYQDGLKLSDIALPEGWAWTKNSMEISVGTSSYPAVYTPSDTTKYNTVTRDISFTVTKAIPNCHVPENLGAKIGDRLGSIALPSGFVWESDTEIELTQAGEYTFYLSYNPNEDNYYTVDHIPVIVQATGESTEPSGSGQTGTGNNSGNSAGDNDNSTGGNGGGTSGSNTGNGTSGGNNGNGGGTSGNSTGNGTSGGNNGNGGGTSGNNTGNGTADGNSSGGSTSDSSGSIGGTGNTSSGSTGAPSGGAGTSNGSAGTSSGGAGTSNGSTGTSSGSTGTSNGSTGISSGSTGTSTGSNNTSSGGTGTSTGNNNTSSGSTGSSNGSANTSSNGAGTSAGNSNTSSSNTGNSNGNTNSSSGTTSTPSGSGTSSNSANTQTGAAGNTSVGTNAPANSTSGTTAGNNNNSTNGTSGTGTSPEGTADTAPGNSDTNSDTSSGNANTPADNAGASTNNTNQMPEEQTFFKPSVTIQMEDTTMLTAEMLQMAKEQNFNLILDVGDYTVWDIDIDLVDVEMLTTIDMGVAIGTNNIPQELIEAILNGNKYLEITLAHDGAFGFAPVLRIALNPADCGRYANLFYYNAEMETLEFICDSIIGADGVASFRMEHASGYVIIISDQSMAGVALSANMGSFDDSEEHNAGRIIWCAVIILALTAVGGGIFFYRKKGREIEEEEEEEHKAGTKKYNTNEKSGAAGKQSEKRGNTRKDSGNEKRDGSRKYKKDEPEDEEGYLDEEYEQDEIEIEELEEESKNKKSEKSEDLEKSDEFDDDDWIDDEDWQEQESKTLDKKPEDEFSDENEEDDWIDDDEWDIGNDWMDDDEWEKKKRRSKKT